MPAAPGETLLTTLFADVHYFFSDPAARPPHHRFDRGSYVYLFQHGSTRQARIEVANAAGTPQQDAFHGNLHLAQIRYDHLQPALISMKVQAHAVPDHTTWHLPSYDVKNEQKFLHKLHAVDIYLWTEKDAAVLLGHLKAVMGAERMDIVNAPVSRTSVASSHEQSTASHDHRGSMSPVVQQLEKTAIGSQFAPRSASTVSAASFPGPPTPAASVESAMAAATPQSVERYTPLAAVAPAPVSSPQSVGGYNPAAPAAPEPVNYREKTPPPEDDGTGLGLKQASRYETVPQAPSAAGFHPQQTQPGFYPQQTAAGFHPQQTVGFHPQQTAVGSHPQQTQQSFQAQQTQPAFHPQQTQAGFQQQYAGGLGSVPVAARPGMPSQAPSFGPMAASTIGQAPGQVSPPPPPQLQQPVTQYASYPAHLQQQNAHFANYPGSPGYKANLPPTPSAPPAYSGPPQAAYGQPVSYAPHFAQPPAHEAVTPPIGGFSSYSYSTTAGVGAGAHHGQSGAYVGDAHAQVYRPTEEELAHGHAKPRRTGTDKDGKPKLEEGFGRLEGKMSNLLTRLDKLW